MFMRVLLAGVLWLPATLGIASHYRAASLAADRTALTLAGEHGPVQAPRTGPEQRGFDLPRIAPDGRSAGWLSLEDGCCESYPLPTEIVLFRDDRIVRRMAGASAIWDWGFSADGQAIAWRERAAHGPGAILYRLVRVADGIELARFTCLPTWATTGSAAARRDPGQVPAWVWPIADPDCPTL